jgi:putative nucleotidyltransferase with HDIG domain
VRVEPARAQAVAERSLTDRLLAEPPVAAVREALAGQEAWIVGGSVRDALLGRPIRDVDVAVRGEPERAAKAVAKAVGGPVFKLSEAFGGWRALHPDREWVCDVTEVHGDGIEADLARRDFTMNAIAVPIGGGEPLDPQGGAVDLAAGVIRVIGGPALEQSSYADDPLRPLRLVRLATELDLQPDPDSESLTREAAPRVAEAAAERVWAELRRLVTSQRVMEGLELSDRLGITEVVLPELSALHGVEQSHFHHLDVHDHTLEVLRQALYLERNLAEVFGDELAAEIYPLMREPLADELTRWQALRFGALLHDAGKPATRGVRPDGRVTFIGHDSAGVEIVGRVSKRLRTSDRLRQFLAGLTRHHLVLGFLVHERPLDPKTVYRYLRRTEPVEVEVTLLSCADRLATRGKNAEPAIEAHLELARELMAEALVWRTIGPPRALPGDELAEALGIEPGPELGALLERLREAVFTGEVKNPDEAIELARKLRDNPAA